MASQYFTALTTKQKAYRDNVLAGMSKREAKRLAGYAESSESSKIETPQLKAQFARLVRQSIPAHHIAKRLAEGVDATKTIACGEDGATMEVTDFRERREYVKIAAQFGGYVETESQGGSSTAIQVNVKFIGEKE
jgi:hypothetical protein